MNDRTNHTDRRWNLRGGRPARVTPLAVLVVVCFTGAAQAFPGRVVVVSPQPVADVPIGPNERVGAVAVVNLPGGPVALVRVDAMPVKPKFNVITPNGVSHPFTDGPTGAGDIEVTWSYTYVHDFENGDYWHVEGALRKPGAGVIGRTGQDFPPGSQLVPDPPQPPGLIFWCNDAVAVSPKKEARILAAAGLPDNPGPEVWLVPSGDVTFWHPAAPAPEVVHFDALPAQHTDFVQEFTLAEQTELVGWAEYFDDYDPSVGLHGQGGWQGWDNDPAFDAALVVGGRSTPLAVEVAGATDIVNDMGDRQTATDVARWSFAAWQYIPSDFESGGGGAFAGSYFVLLNAYEDGGPHPQSDWSVQMQFDSNDGMLKVYYGNGLNTVDVPYETDRWVKIEAIVDLENDWTRVYYDDNLITEYAWTGGVLGGGGGASDIAAVDLFANGASSVFYDDLLLSPLPSGNK